MEDFTVAENITEPAIYGCQLGGQPAERKPGSRYADFKWPEPVYPKYISGGGFLMNRAAAVTLQKQIPRTPVISIDDAFIGIAMVKAGFPDHIHNQREMFRSWGFRNSPRDKFDICKINQIIYFHQFTVKELNCFWEDFITLRKLCQANGDPIHSGIQIIQEVKTKCKWV